MGCKQSIKNSFSHLRIHTLRNDDDLHRENNNLAVEKEDPEKFGLDCNSSTLTVTFGTLWY